MSSLFSDFEREQMYRKSLEQAEREQEQERLAEAFFSYLAIPLDEQEEARAIAACELWLKSHEDEAA